MIYNNKVYANADDKYMKNTILYAHTNIVPNEDNISPYLFHDKEYTKPVLSTEILDMWLKGIVVSITEIYNDMEYVSYEPVLCVCDPSELMAEGWNWTYTLTEPEAEEVSE